MRIKARLSSAANRDGSDKVAARAFVSCAGGAAGSVPHLNRRPTVLLRWEWCVLGALAAAALMALALLPGSVRALPADRGYEQVTPADKGDADLDVGFYTGASLGGERVHFVTRVPLPGSASAVGNEYVAERGAGGWSTISLTPPVGVETLTSAKFHAFTPDLSVGLLGAFDPPVLLPGERLDIHDLFLRDIADGDLTLVTGTEPAEKSATGSVNVFWASPDLRHVLFDPTGRTRYFEGDAGQVFYHADAATGEVSFPALVPDESTADPDDEIRVGTPPFQEATPGYGVLSAQADWNEGAISDDGSRIFFTAGLSVSTTSLGDGVQLYVRKDHGTPGAHTVRVSAPEPGASDPTGEQWPAWFRAASRDGSRVFFTSCDPLTADSTADATGANDFLRTCDRPIGEQIGKSDLYMFEVDADGGAGDLVDLTGTEMTVNDDPSVPADVWGFVGAAEDGSRAYFVALGNLTADASGSGPKLYVWEEGSGLDLVATLDPEMPFKRPQTDIVGDPRGDSRVWLPPASRAKEARVTPDGRHLAFASRAQLEPGFDNTEASAEACGDPEVAGEACYQIYLYDAVADELVCASCVGSGPAAGDAKLRQVATGTGLDVQTGMIERRNLADDGSAVFFETAAGLVADDANRNVDVYGFNAASGEAFLVSSGNRGHSARFTNASASGDDAFFMTREQLVGWDVDDRVDIYDARVSGGFPEPPPPPPDCGLDCQGEPAPPPAQQELGSGAFAGAGNLDACGVLGHRRARVHRRAGIRQRQARRLALRARRTSGRPAIRRARRARLVYRRARLLHRHELRLTRRMQRCVSERSE